MVFTTRAIDDELEVAARYRDYARSRLRERKSELEEAKELVEKLTSYVEEAEREYKKSKSYLKKAEKKHERRMTMMEEQEFYDEDEEDVSVDDDEEENDYYDRKPSVSSHEAECNSIDIDEGSGYVYDTPPRKSHKRRRLMYEDDDDEDQGFDGYTSENHDQHRPHHPAAVTPIWSPSSKQNRNIYHGDYEDEDTDNVDDDDDWIADMHYFLETIPHGRSKKVCNTTNSRNVMLRVKQLASGEGISYAHWPKSKVFAKKEPIDLFRSDFDDLLERAKKWETKYGRDRGNGWLLKHPLTKLKIYQEYRLKNNKKSKKKSCGRRKK